MDVTTKPAGADCKGVSEVLSRVGDKWTIQVVVVLRAGSLRFNGIKRRVDGISQQMLTRTLRTLERDGMVERTVHPNSPPQVEYTLTPLGHSLSETARQLADWAAAHRGEIEDSRQQYDSRGGRDVYLGLKCSLLVSDVGDLRLCGSRLLAPRL